MSGVSYSSIKPLAIDLYAGLGGWTDGLLSEGWTVFGFDIERHEYGDKRYPAQLVLQDVLTLHGAQFRDADLIVASPPCQEFSYRAMPWKRAKALPPPYLGMRLFWACFRIQAEACEAAGRYIPLVVENVCGAQRWVGDARWHYGSYYLWGDIPALMPHTGTIRKGRSNFHFFENTGLPSPSFHGAEHEASVQRYLAVKVASLDGGRRTDLGKGARFTSRDCGIEGVKVAGLNWSNYGKPGYKAEAFNGTAEKRNRRIEGTKNGGGSWFAVANNTGSGHSKNPVHEAAKQQGRKGLDGKSWIRNRECDPRPSHGNSPARKAASAEIARIPFPLAQHIARCFKPEEVVAQLPLSAKDAPDPKWMKDTDT